MANLTKKDLVEKLAQQTNINKSAASNFLDIWMTAYSNSVMNARTVLTGTSLRYSWRKKEDADTVLILVGPRQCGKTRFLHMWKTKTDIPGSKLHIVDIRQELSHLQSTWGNSEAHIEKVMKGIEEKQQFYTIIENSYFKTNDDYMRLIRKFPMNTRIEFHFWRDDDGVYEKPDPVAMCFVTGYQNISVKEHYKRNRVNPYHDKEAWKKGGRK